MKEKRAFTLIEVVLVIVVLGIALTPLCILVVQVVQKNVLSQAQATAVSLAEGEIERLTNARFSQVTCEASTPFSGAFSGYSYSTDVDYVNSGDLNTSVGRPAGCSGTPGTATNYKRIRLSVNHAIARNITLTTVVVNK
jgi:prepilin-type N-terminal cleavage/methylation domain-containing protein